MRVPGQGDGGLHRAGREMFQQNLEDEKVEGRVEVDGRILGRRKVREAGSFLYVSGKVVVSFPWQAPREVKSISGK